MAERAVFLDRDGVVNIDTGYLHRIDQFSFIGGAVDALWRLQRAGWRLVVVTNQSGIARGLYTEADYQRLTQHMSERLAQRGVHLDAVLHCPHAPGRAPHQAPACSCRKPQPGLLLRAAQLLPLDLPRSVMVGDKLSDLQAGRAAGVGRCLLVCSGQPVDARSAAAADAVHHDLAAVAAELLAV